jgi:hypothetical protein
MIGVEAGTDNFQVGDCHRAKKRGMNFGESENEPGSSGFVAKPGCDAAFQYGWRKETQNHKRKQNETKREQWFLPWRHTSLLARNHAGGKPHHSTFAAS